MSTGSHLVCRLRAHLESGEQVFAIGDRAVVLGRAPDCDLVLQHESISRHHARFRREDDGWTITDLGSKNGTRVNTFRVSEQPIRDGDRIDVGTLRLYVEISTESAPTRAKVVFQDAESPSMHTEVLPMKGLDSLLQAARGGDEDPGVDLFASGLQSRSGETGNDAAGLLRLVGEAAEALLSTTTLAETLDRILALVFAKLPVERGVICLYDAEMDSTEPMVMRTREGIPDKPIGISTNIARDAIERKQAVLVRDTKMDDRFGGAESVIMMRIHSAMCAPLYRDDNVTGFIYVDRQSGTQPLEMSHLHALSTLALLSALAVQQAGLRESVRREQELRARLARYSSPAVVEKILQAPGGAARTMVAEDGDVTVLFADLTGFTPLAEQLESADVVRILNQIFERLSTSVFDLEGTLDKFRGDGMMAFFGAPLPQQDHAARAVEAAIRMQESLAALNAARGGTPIEMRIGINSGAVVVGDIGSPQRKDYTVIGDVVNIASRLESGVAKPGQIIIGRATHALLQEQFNCEQLAPVRVKGKRNIVEPYLVRGRIPPSQEPTHAL